MQQDDVASWSIHCHDDDDVDRDEIDVLVESARIKDVAVKQRPDAYAGNHEKNENLVVAKPGDNCGSVGYLGALVRVCAFVRKTRQRYGLCINRYVV